MKQFDLAPYTFLIVDDVRLCRLNVVGILKNLHCKNIHHATNGREAISFLEESSQKVNCVISDFIMPEMNGLQLAKAIRSGVENTRRDLPIAMLTGHGDESLVGLALRLDVNAFLLKPANKTALATRLESVLRNDQGEKLWLKSSEFYANIPIDIDLNTLTEEKTSPIRETIAKAIHPNSQPVKYSIDDVPENSVLVQEIQTFKNRLLYPPGTVLTVHHISRLLGLKEIQFWDGDVWVEPNVVKSNTEAINSSEIELNPFASTSTESGFKTTLSQYGTLSPGQPIPCSRCKNPFEPDTKLIRQHNRGELVWLLCDFCDERNSKLLCACVKLMVLKGGFPIKITQFIEAFFERDPELPSNKDDPFESYRNQYADEPLTKNDLLYWVRAHYFVMDQNTEKLECLIDRIMGDPERVKLLGTIGLDAKRMASKRALLQQRSI